VRFLVDANIPASIVAALRVAGHDVDYLGERPQDPGDAALLREAYDAQRIVLTKDHDIGVLVFRDSAPHAGVILLDDLGDPHAEEVLVSKTLGSHVSELVNGAFLRVTELGVRIGSV
jgi:predicted nuclease of predicted toxin-antitoxin system